MPPEATDLDTAAQAELELGGHQPAVPEVPPAVEVPPVTTEEPEVKTETPEPTPLKEGEQPQPVETDKPELFYGESTVEIDIPEDLSAELEAKGLNASEIAAELYRKDGAFELTPETKEKLDAAYGKFAVDAFLGALKTQNDGFLKGEADKVEQAKQADDQRYSEIESIVGGAEAWASMESFALETLSDDDLAGFNAVMTSGNKHLQQFAVRELMSRQRAAQGDKEAILITGDPVSHSESAPMTAQEFREADAELSKQFRGDNRGYMAASQKLNARRAAGIAKGI